MDIGDSINSLENSLRDLVELVLKQTHGDSWFEHLGISDEHIAAWKTRREEEPKRRPGGTVEQRLLFYSEFHDIVKIVRKSWDPDFKDCFKDLKRFGMYMDRLSAFRNPDAHSRALLPFEEHLVLGMTGELRQEITLFLSSGAGGPEPEYFARIEEIRDSYGTRVTGIATGGLGTFNCPTVLRPGDMVTFTLKAWDPEDGKVQWKVSLETRRETVRLEGPEVQWVWNVEEKDVSEPSRIRFGLESERRYSRHAIGIDDLVELNYRVLPPRR